MKNITIIILYGCCMLSIALCENFPGDLTIYKSGENKFMGLTVGGTLIVKGNGNTKVIGNATIELDAHISANVDIEGYLTIKRETLTSGWGNISVSEDATIEGDLLTSGWGKIYIKGVLTVRGAIRRSGYGNITADGGIVNFTK